mgnify:FL=1
MAKEWKRDKRLYRYGDLEVELFGKAGKYDFIDVGFGVGIGCREFVVVK